MNPLGQPKGKHAPRLRLPVSVPEKYEEEIIDLVMGEPVGVNAKGKPIIEYQPYTVEIKRKNGEYNEKANAGNTRHPLFIYTLFW
ncbi:hypothetical protein [Parageobacillus toebii]|uniref:hypothetical protein n=1 Tax=Parageobacillus toebii TaxID=153151 RepID=UPI00296F9E24|nr:hypothetical protein [Parageobacillus toebii]MED4989317.1 hypothetical protein [Parageobacillus toebii]